MNEDNSLIAERQLLHVTAVEGRDDLIKVLLDAGADVNRLEYDGKTALHFAAIRGHASTARLLAKGGTDLDVTYGRNGYTALYDAASRGHLDVARVLLALGADPDIQSVQGQTALIAATSKEDEDMVRLLISFGADLNLYTSRLETALHKAAREENPNTVRVLLKAGADPTLLNDDGETPLIRALYRTVHNIIEAFLVPGPSLAAIGPRRGNNVLNLCIYYEVESCVRKLLRFELPFSLDEQNNGNHRTPLIEAIRTDLDSAAMSLVDHGADVNLRSFDPDDGDVIDGGMTPLIFAVYRSPYDTASGLSLVRKLVDAGARVDDQDTEGLTALHHLIRRSATSERTIAMLDALIGAAVDANRPDWLDLPNEDGKTPLHIALDRGLMVYAYPLVEAGATVQLEEDQYESLFENAVADERYKTVVKLTNADDDLIGNVLPNSQVNKELYFIHIPVPYFGLCNFLN